MGDIAKGNQATSYPASLDTETPVANCSGTPCIGGDALIAGHINNPVGAIIAIETALGITPQGTAASVAARLAIMLANDGGIPRGTGFPGSPVNVPQLFYRTDQNLLYFYNTGSGTWIQFLTASALSAYVPIASPVTITAQHTFNPPIVEAPFTLGANATGQRVTGLTADTLYDGVALRSASPTPGANIIPVEDASGHLPATIGGAASTPATLDTNTRLVQAANTIWDGTGNVTPSTTAAASKLAEANSSGLLDPTWLQKDIKLKTTGYAVAPGDSVIELDATGGSFTLTFPAASTMARQSVTLIKTTAANIVTLSGTFLGASSVILSDQFETLELYSDSVSWNFIKIKAPKFYTQAGTGSAITVSTGVEAPLNFASPVVKDTNNNFGNTYNTCTTPIASPGIVNLTSHGFMAGQPVVFQNNGGNLPGGIVAGTIYYVIAAGLGANSFEISATASTAGAAINFVAPAPVGTQSVAAANRYQPTVTGYYFTSAAGGATAVTTMTALSMRIVKNGHLGLTVCDDTLVVTFTPAAGANIQTLDISGLIFLNGTTDFIEVLGGVVGTGALNLLGDSFSAFRVA